MGRMVELGRVSRSSFYRFGPERKTGADREMELRDAIQRIALEWPCYGRPRVTQELRRQGWTVNPKRVYRLMPCPSSAMDIPNAAPDLSIAP
jgi:putative transposase